MGIRGIPTGDEDDLRRRSELVHERSEVRILGHDQRPGVARGVEDVQVSGPL
jgi:hypothetical protein